MSSFLTVDMLREFLDDTLDKLSERRGGDLLWDDATLEFSMQAAVREFNSIPPYGVMTAPDAGSLPVDSNLWFNGAAAQAARRRARALRLEAVRFAAGGIETAPDETMLQGLEKMAVECQQAFNDEVLAKKAHAGYRAQFFRA